MRRTAISRQGKIIAVVVIVILVAAALAAFYYVSTTTSTTTTAPTSITVGYNISLSGPAASYGLADQTGIITWATMINNSGGLYVAQYGKSLPIHLIGLDDKSDPQTGLTNVEQLYADHVDLIGGVSSSGGVGLVTYPYVDKQNGSIPCACVSATTSPLDALLGNTTWVNGDVGYPVWAAYNEIDYTFFHWLQNNATKLSPQPTTIAIVYSAAQANSVSEAASDATLATALGYKVVMDTSFAAQQSDYTSLVLQAKALNPDIFFEVNVYEGDMITILTDMKEQNYNPPIVYEAAGDDPTLAKTAGSLMNDVLVDTWWTAQNNNTGNAAFISAYEAIYHTLPPYSAVLWYAPLQIWQAAVAKCGCIDAAGVLAAERAIWSSGITVPTIAGNWVGDVSQPAVGPIQYPLVQWQNGTAGLATYTVYPYSQAEVTVQYPRIAPG